MKAQGSLVSSDKSQAMLASSKQEARFAGGTTSRSMNGSDAGRIPKSTKVRHQGTFPNDAEVTKAARDSVETGIARHLHPQVGEGGASGAIKSWIDKKNELSYPNNIDELEEWAENWEEEFHKDFPTNSGAAWPEQPDDPPPNTGAKGYSGSSSSHAAAAGGLGGIVPNFSSGPSVSPGPIFKSQSNTDSKDDAPVDQIKHALDASSKPASLATLENSVKSQLRPPGKIIDSPGGQVIGQPIGGLSGGGTVIYSSKPSKNKTGLVMKDQLLQAPTTSKKVKGYVALSDPKVGAPKVCGCKAVPSLGLSKKRPDKNKVHTVIDGDFYKQSSKFSLQKPAGWDSSSTVFNNVVEGSSTKRPRNHVVSVAAVSVGGGRTYNTLAYKVDESV